MGIKISLIKDCLNTVRKNSGQKYIGALKPAFNFPSKNSDLLNLTYKTSLKQTTDKTAILAKYCQANKLNAEEVTKQFDNLAVYLDDISKENLLNLADSGKIVLYTPQAAKKKVFLLNRTSNDRLLMSKTEGILNYSAKNPQETAATLKLLLALQKEGKLEAENIVEVLKLKNAGYNDECLEIISKLRSGEIKNENILQAQLLTANEIPLEILNPKNLEKYSKFELNRFSLILQSCRKELPRNLLLNILKEQNKLVKINKVPQSVSNAFLKDIEKNLNVFAASKHSIDELVGAGGVKLEYSRENFKENIFSKIKHLPEDEQNKILNKFGLNNQSDNILSGLPVLAEKNSKLNSLEASVNDEIKKFLYENKVILPKGFEEYQEPLDSICKTFPEFIFTIGAKQHKTHTKPLAEHMLMALQENTKNPLYQTLSASDKRVLGISTLLHDLSKTETLIDGLHPLTSSQAVNAIVQRMNALTTTEKNRIINFVENHHWLMKIQNGTLYNPQTVRELAFTFRHGNDFNMAKIFAESDLKAVNDGFYTIYGSKIQSPMTKAIEEEIFKLQKNGRMVFTKDITLDKAIEAGAEEIITGSGKETVKNRVIGAKKLNLDKENIAYHAAKDNGLMSVAANCGYKKGLVLSASVGRKDKCATYGNYPEFVGFRQLDMNNTASAFVRNTKYGKDYEKLKDLAFNDTIFSKRIQELCPVSDKDYAAIYREISCNNIKADEIHLNKNIQKILGGETKALEFENAVKKANKELESTADRYGEIVIMDPELGFIGTKRGVNQMSYELRKFCADNNILIVDFTK